MVNQETYQACIDYIEQHGGGGGTSDYRELANKPSINNHTLNGNSTLGDIGAAEPSVTYLTTDSASATINDTDYIPMATTNGAKKKTLFSTLKEKLLGNTDISAIGATVTAAISALNTGKQNVLTNPLTKSDVVNNLTTTTTNVPLSAAQGKALQDGKVAKTGDTMTGLLNIQNNSPQFRLTRHNGSSELRFLAGFIDTANNFYIHDYINGTYVGTPAGIYGSSRTLAAGYRFDANGGIIDNAGWMDWYWNGANRLNIYCNYNDPENGATVRNPIGSLQLYTPNNGSVIRLSTNNGPTYVLGTQLAIGNSAWSAGSPVYAGSYNAWSTKLMKENIESLTEEDGNKLLQLRPVSFDFKKAFGGAKDNIGLIAEEALEVIPEIVTVPEGYDESEFDESKGLNNKLLTVDYVKLTPYLVKLCQTQQKQIDELTERVSQLEEIINKSTN